MRLPFLTNLKTSCFLAFLAGISALLSLAILPVNKGTAFGQTFDSGSDGSDGALNLTELGTIIFDPRSFDPPLDPDGDNVYHFTTINIGESVTVRMRAPELRGHPVIWLASGDVQIDGVLDLSGEDGHPATNLISDRRPSIPGAGGYPGGVGGTGTSPNRAGLGPGGAPARACDGGCGNNASHATLGRGGLGTGPVYGNAFLVPLLGGSGGSGGPPASSLAVGVGGGQEVEQSLLQAPT